MDIKGLSEKEIKNCLTNIGCDNSVIEQLMKDGINKQRMSALDTFHLSQDKLNCIDYLIYQIRRAD